MKRSFAICIPRKGNARERANFILDFVKCNLHCHLEIITNIVLNKI